MADRSFYVFEGGFKWYIKLPKGLFKALSIPFQKIFDTLADLINQIYLWLIWF